MYVYLIKCSIYYKIGYSKNPKNRLKTVKTHNPLDVTLLATLKTDDYLNKEKELHTLFSNKNAKREWFELHTEDLLNLKVNYGFNFLIPINSLETSEIKNKHVLDEVKSLRIDNNKIDHFISYFEQLFNVKINDPKEIKKCCNKFDTYIIKEAIDSLYNQDKNASISYDLLFRVCSNLKQIEENPSKYVAKIIKAIMYSRYSHNICKDDFDYLESSFNTSLDANEVVKELNSQKFYLGYDAMWELINNKYMI